VTHPESIAEVRSILGPDATVACVHGFSLPAFRERATPADARARLGLPPNGKIVLVSGGGWGVGDIEGAVDAALAIEAASMVVCLCGRNEVLRATLSERFADEPRVRVEGFTDEMPEWLAAADVLVHSTGGLTVLEALMRGCPAISYGWGRGHVRLNNRAFVQFGLAHVVERRSDLRAALEAALAAGRTETHDFDSLPSAASYVLAAAHAT
jgi:processive 1,2-diacylglycerol beta-glucosyltransferase